MLPEIATGGCFDSVKAGAKVDTVYIKLQNLLLGIAFLDPTGEHGFESLAVEITTIEFKRGARQLLSQGAGTFPHLVGPQVLPNSACHSHEINAVMLVKSRIFPREERRGKIWRDSVQRYDQAILTVKIAI